MQFALPELLLRQNWSFPAMLNGLTSRALDAGGPNVRIWLLTRIGGNSFRNDCMVELVGLEPTARVLWNVVRVRPAPLVGRPSRSPDVLLFCVIMLAF